MSRNILKISSLLILIFPKIVFAQTILPGVIDQKSQMGSYKVPKTSDFSIKSAKPKNKKRSKNRASRNKKYPTLKSVKFTGNSVVSDEKLQFVTQEYIGKKLTKSNLADLKYKVKKAFFDQGYILVRVVTPSNAFKKGTLNISIYESKIGRINIKNNSGVSDKIIASIIANAESGEVIEEGIAESTISDLNDLQGVAASLNLKPGQKISTTDFDIILSKKSKDNNYASVNNYGSKLNGKNVASAHLEHSNLFDVGDKYSADLYKSQGEGDLQGFDFSFSTPLPYKNINLEASYLYMESEIGDDLKPLGITGKNHRFNLALSSKLSNSRKKQITIKSGIEARSHETFLLNDQESKDNIRKLFLNLSNLYRFNDNILYISSNLSKGIDAFGASHKGEDSASRNSGDQDALIFKPLVISYLRPFEDPTKVIKVMIKGQLASKTLLSSDLFTIGGYDSVRGFSVAQEFGESGYNFLLEYNQLLPFKLKNVNFTIAPFFDGGAVYSRVQGTIKDQHLYSAGLGLEMGSDKNFLKNTKFRFDWAHPVGSYNSSDISGEMLYFNILQKF